jgi:hypothetical protein
LMVLMKLYDAEVELYKFDLYQEYLILVFGERKTSILYFFESKMWLLHSNIPYICITELGLCAIING